MRKQKVGVVVAICAVMAISVSAKHHYNQTGKFSNVIGVVDYVESGLNCGDGCKSAVLWVNAGQGTYPMVCDGVNIAAQCNRLVSGNRVLLNGYLLIGSSTHNGNHDLNPWVSLLIDEITLIERW